MHHEGRIRDNVPGGAGAVKFPRWREGRFLTYLCRAVPYALTHIHTKKESQGHEGKGSTLFLGKALTTEVISVMH